MARRAARREIASIVESLNTISELASGMPWREALVEECLICARAVRAMQVMLEQLGNGEGGGQNREQGAGEGSGQGTDEG